MKKLSLSICVIVLFSMISLISCSKQENQTKDSNSQQAKTQIPKKSTPAPCCTASCGDGGTCSAYGAPCTCRCSPLWGTAKCSGTSPGSTHIITGTTTTVSYYDGLSTLCLSFGTVAGNNASVHLTQIKNLFSSTLLNISDPLDVSSYDTHNDALTVIGDEDLTESQKLAIIDYRNNF